MSCEMGENCYCNGAPYGCGGDHCPWCGCDWKGTHRPDCEKFEGCDHNRRNSHPRANADGQLECANCYEPMPEEQMVTWRLYPWWISEWNVRDEKLREQLKKESDEAIAARIESIIHTKDDCSNLNNPNTMLIECMCCERELLCFSCNFGKSGGHGWKNKDGKLDDDPKIPRRKYVCKQCVDNGEYDKLPDLTGADRIMADFKAKYGTEFGY